MIALSAAAGILTATFTTILGAIRREREKRNWELFRAYVHHPHEVEAWLVHGALN